VGLGFIFAPNFSSLSPEVAKDYIAGGEIMLIISFFGLFLITLLDIEVEIDDSKIILKRFFFGLKIIEKHILFSDIKALKVTGFPRIGIKIVSSEKSISFGESISFQGIKLPELRFNSSAPGGQIRNFYKLKVLLLQKTSLQDDDPFAPYET
jgi:hypothetical protein